MLPKSLRRSNPGRFRAIVYAVLVHAVVIGLAFVGFRWTVDSPPGEQVIQATAITEKPPKPEDDKRARQEELERQKAEEERRRQEELKRKQEELEEQQRLIAERKKKEAEEQERQRRAAEEQRMQEELRKKAEQRKKEEQRKQEEQRRQKLAEESLQQQLAAEEQARQQAQQQAARSARAATEIDKYRLLIRQRVSRSWNRPLGVAPGLKCVVRVNLTPGGEVLSAKVVRSSGNTVFDRSVENAVYKAAPLPLPEDPTLFDNFREIEFLFSPEE